MAAILENGGHIEILRGPRFFLEGWPLKSVCAKSVACIIIWTILLPYAIICSTSRNRTRKNKFQFFIEENALENIDHFVQALMFSIHNREQH